jgi:reactive chlorine resistance protein C
MSSISIEIVRARTGIERVVNIEGIGKAIVRWGLVLLLAWIAAMKFTTYEATGIEPLVSHSPLVAGCTISFSTMLGFIEIGTAVLIALWPLSPKASAIGSVLAIGLFATTLSFLFSTPGWEPSLGWLPRPVSVPWSIPARGHRAFGSVSLVAGRIAEGRRGLTRVLLRARS